MDRFKTSSSFNPIHICLQPGGFGGVLTNVVYCKNESHQVIVDSSSSPSSKKQPKPQESYSYKDLDILPSPAWPSFVESSLLPKRMYKHVRYKNYIPTQGADFRGCFTPLSFKKKQQKKRKKEKKTNMSPKIYFNRKCIFQTLMFRGHLSFPGKQP